MFLLNSLDDFHFGEVAAELLPGVEIVPSVSLPERPDDVDLIVPWSLRRLIRSPERYDNLLVLHSSDLPTDKGWAPIFHTIAERRSRYVMTGFKPNADVDAGDIVVKASFPLSVRHTASILRAWDGRLTLMVVAAVLEHFRGRKLVGRPQTEPGNLRARRSPSDNELKVSDRLADVVDLIRASEASHPAYLALDGEELVLEIRPRVPPTFPEHLDIEFFDGDVS